MSDETTDPVADSPFLIDEELGSVSTVVGSLGEVDPGEDNDEDAAEGTVTTEVGTLGWPEGAENEEGVGPA